MIVTDFIGDTFHPQILYHYSEIKQRIYESDM